MFRPAQPDCRVGITEPVGQPIRDEVQNLSKLMNTCNFDADLIHQAHLLRPASGIHVHLKMLFEQMNYRKLIRIRWDQVQLAVIREFAGTHQRVGMIHEGRILRQNQIKTIPIHGIFFCCDLFDMSRGIKLGQTCL